MTDPDAPLRLEAAIRIAFPGGGITIAGLRKERDRGNLVVEKIANKEYTTLNHIQNMRTKCRVQPKGLDCNSDPPATDGRRIGRSSTRSTVDMKKALDAARETVLALKRL